MTFKIVTDSCCNLPEDIIDDLDLTIFPLVFMIGEEQHQSYLKGEVTDLQQFYTHMREGKVFTTSLPNLKDAEADLKAIFESGTMYSTLVSQARFREPMKRSISSATTW